MRLAPINADDIPQIQDWMQADEYLQNKGDASWWLSGADGLLSFCGLDDDGPIFFVKLIRDGDYAKMFTVFGPTSEVAPKRIVKAILAIVPQLGVEMRAMNCKGIVFETKSESLVAFMRQLGFETSGDVQKWQFGEVG